MNTMHLFDWIIFFVLTASAILLARQASKYTLSVTDFLASNRLAGRYVLTLAEGIAGWGAIGIIANFQLTYKVGFASGWWANLGLPVALIMNLAGWVIYRYRQTRALTLAQFFEMRYNRNFRIIAGFICWLAGILNFGIFPAVTANFFINYCGFPQAFEFLGLTISTYPVLLIILIGTALYFTFAGGQITIMVTDFCQSMVFNIVLISVVLLALSQFPLSKVFEGLLISPENKSMVNPFHTAQSDFNPWYFVIGVFGMIFNRMAWQSNQGYNCSAKSPHEAKMAGVLQGFRSWGFTTNIVFLPLVAYLIMNHPDYSSMAHNVSEKLSLINNEQIRDQMLTPITMTLYIPIGLMGAFAAVMFLADIGSNDVYLHSWGSILVQDVILPLRKTPLSSKQHMIYLRASIVFVAIFIFFFSFLFRQTQHILYFFAITGAIWLGGAGAVIVGGLYTRWGNARGAFAALISGSTVAVTGIICEQSWAAWYGPGQKFFLTGQEVYFVAIVVASTLYIAFSLLGKRTPFDLDRMLHRKEHAGESARNTAEIPAAKIKRNFKGLIGITDEFTLGDKLIYFFSTAQTAIFFVLFVTMTLFAIFYDLSDKSWVKYHYYVFFFSIIASVVIAIWLGIFGLRDMIRLFADLKAMKRDAADNGRVECQSAPEKVPHDSQPVTPVN